MSARGARAHAAAPIEARVTATSTLQPEAHKGGRLSNTNQCGRNLHARRRDAHDTSSIRRASYRASLVQSGPHEFTARISRVDDPGAEVGAGGLGAGVMDLVGDMLLELVREEEEHEGDAGHPVVDDGDA